jgi:hypothetical protein
MASAGTALGREPESDSSVRLPSARGFIRN